jgi:hypothetical protein
MKVRYAGQDIVVRIERIITESEPQLVRRPAKPAQRRWQFRCDLKLRASGHVRTFAGCPEPTVSVSASGKSESGDLSKYPPSLRLSVPRRCRFAQGTPLLRGIRTSLPFAGYLLCVLGNNRVWKRSANLEDLHVAIHFHGDHGRPRNLK